MMAGQIARSFSYSGGRAEFLIARRVKEGAAPIDDTADRAGIQLNPFIAKEAFESAPDAEDFETSGERGPYHGPDAGVKPRTVPAGGENADSFHGQ